MSDFIPAPCSQHIPHEPHFYQTFIAGGPVGPVPTVTCLCPGAQYDDRAALADLYGN